jgi:hypothetical protein
LPPVAKRSSVENAEQNPNKTPEKKTCKRQPKGMMVAHTQKTIEKWFTKTKGKGRRRKGNVPGLMC